MRSDVPSSSKKATYPYGPVLVIVPLLGLKLNSPEKSVTLENLKETACSRITFIRIRKEGLAANLQHAAQPQCLAGRTGAGERHSASQRH